MKLKIYTLLLMALLGLVMPVWATELPRPNNFGGDFTLPGTLGKESSVSDWKGKVVLLNFGFTSCPDVCPMVLSKLSLVQKELDKGNKRLQVVFVTIDPERDTIEKMQNYLQHFDSSFVGMRGEPAQVKQILRRYGAVAEQFSTETGVDFSHSDYVYLIDKQGYVAGFYDIKSSHQDLVKAVRKLM